MTYTVSGGALNSAQPQPDLEVATGMPRKSRLQQVLLDPDTGWTVQVVSTRSGFVDIAMILNGFVQQGE